MAIRVRWIDGTLVALCAARITAEADDLYLDDAVHEALATKFAVDWHGNGLLEHELWDEPRATLMRQAESTERGN